MCSKSKLEQVRKFPQLICEFAPRASLKSWLVIGVLNFASSTSLCSRYSCRSSTILMSRKDGDFSSATIVVVVCACARRKIRISPRNLFITPNGQHPAGMQPEMLLLLPFSDRLHPTEDSVTISSRCATKKSDLSI